MSLDILKKRIKENKLSGVFLFTGREEYTKDHYASLIRKKVDSSPLPEFNHIYFDASAQELSMLEDAAFSLPYMWDSKLIEIINFNTAKLTEEEASDYERVFCDIPDYLTILIVLRANEYSDDPKSKKPSDKSAEAKTKKSKSGMPAFLALVRKYGLAVDFDTEDSDKLIAWIIRHFNAAKVTFDANVPREILNYCGSDMYILQSELLKLSTVWSGKPIKAEDIKKYCCQNIVYKYFDIASALNRRDITSAKKILGGLELGRDELPMAVGFLAKNYSDMLLVRMGLDSGRGFDKLASDLKIPSWRIGKIASSVSGIEPDALAFAIEVISDADMKMKSFSANGEKVLEKAFYRICTYGRKA